MSKTRSKRRKVAEKPTPPPPVRRRAKITPRELEKMKEHLGDLARNGGLEPLAAACLVRAVTGEENDSQAQRMLKIAACVTENREVRVLSLMLDARIIRAQFARYDHEERRLRRLVAEALELVRQADTAARWTHDECLAEWTGFVLKDLQKRADDLGPDPNAEPAEDDGETFFNPGGEE